MSLIRTLNPLIPSILPYSYIISARLNRVYTTVPDFTKTKISYDYDPRIKKVYFGNRVLYFYIPDVQCDPAPNYDNDMSNPTIDPDTWMDIVYYH